jgi:polyhydroxyalkanoate synthesis regulator phasin
MDKLTKRGLEIGLGVAAITITALGEVMKDLEQQGKISRKDGEKMVRDMAKKYKVEGAKYAKRAQSQMNELMKSSPIVTRKDLDEINAKIEKINKQLSRKGRK